MPPRYPPSLAPDATPPAAARGQRSRSRREPSGAFQLFQAPQIQQFKEAFSLIDQDGDGIVSEKDLKAIFTNLGKIVILHTDSNIMYLLYSFLFNVLRTCWSTIL